jgi:hypothetical protein
MLRLEDTHKLAKTSYKKAISKCLRTAKQFPPHYWSNVVRNLAKHSVLMMAKPSENLAKLIEIGEKT